MTTALVVIERGQMSWYKMRFCWHHLLVGIVGIHIYARQSVGFLVPQPNPSSNSDLQTTTKTGTGTGGSLKRIAKFWSFTQRRHRHRYLSLSAVTSKSPCFSLAGPFLIRLDHGQLVEIASEMRRQCSFRLISIERFRADHSASLLFQQDNRTTMFDSSNSMTENAFVNQCFLNHGAALLCCEELLKCATEAASLSLTATYSSSSNDDNADNDDVVTISVDDSVQADRSMMLQHQQLMDVLAKVLAQHLIFSYTSDQDSPYCLDRTSVVLPDQSTISLQDCHDQAEVPLRFFGVRVDNKKHDNVEMVEMVDQDGAMIGAVPRSLVHQHNLLHRGVGIFVTRGMPIQLVNNDHVGLNTTSHQPDLYIHRRTATKRIFPSLYDMFVGGLSSMMESPLATARREVGEELGLGGRANDDDDDDVVQDSLSGPILQCVVCTAYNRCVVDLFCYTATPHDEAMIQWQVEEVSWGAFVPYAVVVAAADRSIERCHPWPGSLPRFQSRQRGQLPLLVLTGDYEEISCGPTSQQEIAWNNWDFVPDGLLVWEAWTRFLEQQDAAT